MESAQKSKSGRVVKKIEVDGEESKQGKVSMKELLKNANES